jgi:UDPglucose 6-dehydrogenase
VRTSRRSRAGWGSTRGSARAFLKAGLGYGGSCFPKDVDAFAHLARQVGYEFELLEAVRTINEGQRQLVLDKLEAELWHLDGKTITLLGAAFKPGTDDLREAPAMYLARELLAAGATVRIYDPVALEAVRAELPEAELYIDPARGLPRCTRGGGGPRSGPRCASSALRISSRRSPTRS